jgi:hypothetical protein
LKLFFEIVADNGLEQIVDFPTRKDNTLDLMLLSHPAYKLRCKPLPSIGNSDHDKDVSAVFFFDGAYFFFDLV